MAAEEGCAVCGNLTSKKCSRCRMVKYCSEACQRSHWILGHKSTCKDFQSSGKDNSKQSASSLQRRKSSSISLVPASGKIKILHQSKKVLFPYEEFLELFDWDNPGFPPCGLLNCGNSCFANVVLQFLTYTRPLVAYLLEKGHRRECRFNGWCFLCEFQLHVERASWSRQPFSPINILSRLPNIGSHLGCGKQEDAHEFMRFAVDTMQLVCLDEFGGEKAVPLSTQETTLIQHIFGGHLQSQVVCPECNNISNQIENMMDLTVEIHGDAGSLEECLDQFTAREWLDGDNMYKCDRCNDYVKAWKRLVIQKAPNILTVALKRFQSGSFGKLNKRVTFPETLDLCPYMNGEGDRSDIYKLYAVIVHVDMLNASFFGHYICYIKDFSGSWYMIDDCKVVNVDIDEVLSQEAYMLLYSRIRPRQTSLSPLEPLNKENQDTVEVGEAKQHSPLHRKASPPITVDFGSLPTDKSSETKVFEPKEESSSITSAEDGKEDLDAVNFGERPFGFQELQDIGQFSAGEPTSRPRMSPNGSLIDSFSEAETLKHATQLLVSNIRDKTETCQGTTNKCVRSSSTEDSVAINGEMQDDSSASASSLSLILDNMEFNNSTPLPAEANCKIVSSSDGGGTHDVVVKSDRGISCGQKLRPLFNPGFLGGGSHDVVARSDRGISSRQKLRPLFTPGFLGKRPRNNYANQVSLSERLPE